MPKVITKKRRASDSDMAVKEPLTARQGGWKTKRGLQSMELELQEITVCMTSHQAMLLRAEAALIRCEDDELLMLKRALMCFGRPHVYNPTWGSQTFMSRSGSNRIILGAFMNMKFFLSHFWSSIDPQKSCSYYYRPHRQECGRLGPH